MAKRTAAGWLTLLLGTLPVIHANGADDWESHEQIRAAAAATVRARLAPSNSRVEAVAEELDHRVRLTKCAEPLIATVPYGKKQGPRVTAEVRCPAPRAWKLYVPVRLTVFQPVVVAARALPRGTLLAPGDIELAEQDTGTLSYGFLLHPDHVTGHRLRRALAAGEVVNPGLLETPNLVQRGQRVTLEARNGGLTVRMAGVAKEDGIKGQVIEVENLRTKRIVQAVVRSAKSVEVLLQ